MEEQVTKLLQKQCYDKKFKITKDDQNWITNNAEKIQDLPLKCIHFVEVTSESILICLNLFHNLNLKKLIMTQSEINPEVTNAIVNLIPNLITLDLQRCSIQSCELITIMSAIEQSHVQKLDLSECAFEGTEIIALFNCIANSRLIKLCLRECTFEQTEQNENGLTLIMNAAAHSSLTTLHLSAGIFNDEATLATINCIENSSIVKLSLFGCTFSDNKIITIMRAIQKSTIQILDLGNIFFDDDIEDIMKCIENSSITKFDFGHEKRQYNCVEMKTMVNSIKGNNLLHKVGFAYTNIDDEIVLIICDMIENSTIKTIAFWECGLRDAQITSICNSVAGSNVTSIDLSANHFGVNCDSAAAICNLLEHHNLRKLKMMFNKLTEPFIESILDSIKRSELIKIDVSYCRKLNEPTKQKLKEVMRAQKCKAAFLHKMKSANNI